MERGVNAESTGRKPAGLSDHEGRFRGLSWLRYLRYRRSIDTLVGGHNTLLCRREILPVVHTFNRLEAWHL